MSLAFYNENDPAAVAALEALMAEGFIAPGKIDSRSIKEVQPHDIEGFTQVHWFAGFGGWSMAARAGGWRDDRPLWTASCPCQPYAAAGRRLGADDPRHLWPDLYRLWQAARPALGVGEQVAGKLGYGWFDGVRADLAREKVTSRTVDIPALSVDGPHERNRLYWIAVADAEGERDGLQYECRECCKARRKAWREKPDVDATFSARDAGYRQKYWRERRAGYLLKAIRIRARARKMDFDLDAADIQSRVDKGRCEVTGLPFDMQAKRAWNAPSIDRIDNAKGYTKENTRVVLYALNVMLNTWGEEVVKTIARAMEKQ